MKILFVSATLFEVRPFLENCGVTDLPHSGKVSPGTCIEIPDSKGDCVRCLITGVGQALTAFHLARALQSEWDILVQAGLAGSFTPDIRKCEVVRVVSEVFGDLGAENIDSFLDVTDMNLLDPDETPFKKGRICVPEVDRLKSLQALRSVSSVTVNRVLSHKNSIDWISKRYRPEIVNMEGAAFFYAASLCNVPAIQLRSISDYVGPRDASTWDIAGAVTSLNTAMIEWWLGRGGAELA